MKIGLAELIVIFFIGIMFFGIDKFQNIGKIIGKNVNDFKKELDGTGVNEKIEKKIKDKFDETINQF